jgi:hypothetical protein
MNDIKYAARDVPMLVSGRLGRVDIAVALNGYSRVWSSTRRAASENSVFAKAARDENQKIIWPCKFFIRMRYIKL